MVAGHDKQLREMVEAGKSVTTIALRLKRTVLAVRWRLSILSISVRRINDGSKNPPVLTGGLTAPRPDAPPIRRNLARLGQFNHKHWAALSGPSCLIGISAPLPAARWRIPRPAYRIQR
jgi:hypothetical protein